MDAIISCTVCGARYRVTPDGKEKRYKCRKCGGVMVAGPASAQASGGAARVPPPGSRGTGQNHVAPSSAAAGVRPAPPTGTPGKPPVRAATSAPDAVVWDAALGSLAESESKASATPVQHDPDAVPSRGRVDAPTLPLPGGIRTSPSGLRPAPRNHSRDDATPPMSGAMLAITLVFHGGLLLILLAAIAWFLSAMRGPGSDAFTTLVGGVGLGVIGVVITAVGGLWLLVQAFMRDVRLGAAMLAFPIGIGLIGRLGAANYLGSPTWPITSFVVGNFAAVVAAVMIARIKPSGGHVYLVGAAILLMGTAILNWGPREPAPTSPRHVETPPTASAPPDPNPAPTVIWGNPKPQKQDILNTSPEELANRFPPPALATINQMQSVPDADGNTLVQQAGPDASGRWRRIEGVVRPDGSRVGYEVLPGTPAEETRLGRESKRREAARAAAPPPTPPPAPTRVEAPRPPPVAPTTPKLPPDLEFQNQLRQIQAFTAPDRYLGTAIVPPPNGITPELIQAINGAPVRWAIDFRMIRAENIGTLDLVSGIKDPDGAIFRAPPANNPDRTPISLARRFRRVSLIGYQPGHAVQELLKFERLEEVVWRCSPPTDADQANLASIRSLKRVVMTPPAGMPTPDMATLKSKRQDITIESGRSAPLRPEGQGGVLRPPMP